MEKDIFGLTIYKYWKGNRRINIRFIRDDGKEFELSPKMFFTRHKDFSKPEKQLLKHISGKVLDIGCGAGRHVLYLQKNGYDAEGIDYSKYLIEICRKRGCRHCCQEDIYNYSKKKKFDSIILFGNNLGIARSIKGAYKLLSILKKLLRPNGKILLTSINYEKTTDKSLRQYARWNAKQGKDKGQLRTRNILGPEKTGWINWLYLTPKELKTICKKVGLKITALYRERKGGYGAVLAR